MNSLSICLALHLVLKRRFIEIWKIGKLYLSIVLSILILYSLYPISYYIFLHGIHQQKTTKIQHNYNCIAKLIHAEILFE